MPIDYARDNKDRTQQDINRMVHSMSEDNEDRIRRAKSWAEVAASDTAKGDDAIIFLFMWIAFNAAYGKPANPDGGETERRKFKEFIGRIVEKDKKQTLRQCLMGKSKLIGKLLENEYIYQPFWHDMRERTITYPKSKPDNDYVYKSWKRGETAPILGELMWRLYTLRNQIMHGGTTYGEESWGKRQLRDGAKFMATVMPRIIEIMETDIKTNSKTPYWGPVAYPRFRDSED